MSASHSRTAATQMHDWLTHPALKQRQPRRQLPLVDGRAHATQAQAQAQHTPGNRREQSVSHAQNFSQNLPLRTQMQTAAVHSPGWSHGMYSLLWDCRARARSIKHVMRGAR